MLKVLLAAIVFVGLCVVGLGVNIFFRGKPFPETDVSKNKDMRRLGIKCMHQLDSELHKAGGRRLGSGAGGREEAGSICDGDYDEACESCALYKYEKQ